jgi:hypothetical protein
MSETRSTRPLNGGKPSRVSPEFPLFAHAPGHWDRKIRGKLHHFRRWDDPDGSPRELSGTDAGLARRKETAF